MDDKNVYLNEDNAIFMEGLCKYYKTTDLSFWLDDIEDLPIDLFENGFMEEKFVEKYRSCYYNYKDLLYKLNSSEGWDYYYVLIFTIFKAYMYNKNNFDNFSNIVDDVLSSEINSARFLKGIDIIVRCTNYKEMPNIKRLMTMMLKSYVDLIYLLSPSKELYDSFLAIYKQMIDDYNAFGEKGDIDAFNKVFDFRVGELLKEYGSYENLYGLRKEKIFVAKYYYNKILLKGNRYFYFNEKLEEVEDNPFFTSDIFQCVKDFSVEMFNELNNDSVKDSFITCMDIVFDSDSYTELINKLSCLVEASESYEDGDKVKAFEFIKNLDSPSLKEVYNGEIVSYPNNCMNKVEKPKKIVDRMKALYNKIDNSISYDFIDELECLSIKSMIYSVSLSIRNEKKLSTRVKKKMKEIFSRNKG